MASNLPTVDDDDPKSLRLRLTMRPSKSGGAVDGGWWPWSTDPETEFPGLIMALTSWLGPARDIAYDDDVWVTTARTLTVQSRPVRLTGSDGIPANTVQVTGLNLKTICLLVVPPNAPGRAARAILRSAYGSATTTTVADILNSNGVSPDRPTAPSTVPEYPQ
jgi:hypothetical protein